MSSRIYLGRLPRDVRTRDIERLVDRYGRINDINLRDGFGFVEFDDYRDAEDAVRALDGKSFLGDRIIVEFAKGRRERDRFAGGFGGGGGGAGRGRFAPPVRTENSLLVEGISSRTSWQDLKDFFREYGSVTFADANKARDGEGIIEFSSYEDMKKALKDADGREIDGYRIRLSENSSKSSRRRSVSRSRSRSPRASRRSRSRSPVRKSSRDYSRSPRRDSRSRSRSRSPAKMDVDDDKRKSNDDDKRSPSRTRSAARSPRRSRSRSPAKEDRDASRSRSGSPVRDNIDAADEGHKSD
eukprot:CFRG0414T1